MFRFLLGAAIGGILAFNGADDSCDNRIRALTNVDNWPAMYLPSRAIGEPVAARKRAVGEPVPLHLDK